MNDEEKVENKKIDTDINFDDDNNFNKFVSQYGGATIGGIIALILCVTGIYKLLFCIITVLFGMFLGNYIQRNKIDVKQKLKDFIDRF